jgi:hypothetical protein
MTKNLSTSKEPYRLWYEFLKRAKRQNMKVLKKYDEWGDVSIGFQRWWDSKGNTIFHVVANGVHIATDSTMSDANYHLVAIPKHFSPREARVQTEALMKSLKSEQGKAKQKWQLSEGALPNLIAIRAYLHALDCQDQLIKESVANGGTAKDVKSVHVLCALRKYYIKKNERYKNAKFRLDTMPIRIMHGGMTTDPAKVMLGNLENPNDMTMPIDAVNAVSQFLRKGNDILNSVCKGKFPS